MIKFTYEQKILLLLCLFIFTLVLGIYIGKAITPTYMIHIDTSHEPTLDWFVKYHGLNKCNYIAESGHFFERDGQIIPLLTNPAKSAYAKHVMEPK